MLPGEQRLPEAIVSPDGHVVNNLFLYCCEQSDQVLARQVNEDFMSLQSHWFANHRQQLVCPQCIKESAEERESFDERILGNGFFVDTLLQQDELRDKFAKSWSLPDLIASVGSIFSVSPTDIRQPNKKRLLAEARGIVCYLAVRELGYKGNEVGKELFLTASGVSIAVRRGEYFLNKNKGVKQEIFSKLEK